MNQETEDRLRVQKISMDFEKMARELHEIMERTPDIRVGLYCIFTQENIDDVGEEFNAVQSMLVGSGHKIAIGVDKDANFDKVNQMLSIYNGIREKDGK